MGERSPNQPHAWERWLPTWHALFVLSLGVTNLVAILDQGLGPTTWAALGVSAALLAWYWAFFVRVPPWNPPVWQMSVYVAGLLLAWAILARLAPPFYFLQATIFPQLFFALPIRLAAIAAFGLAVLVITTEAARSPVGFEVAAALGTLAVVAMFIVLSAWIAAIIDQSAGRGKLIEELEATRGELAAAERETGILEERARLAREIHDTLAQGFTSVVLHLEAADELLATDPVRARHHVDEARRTARDSLAESRRFLAALRPEALESSSLVETLGRVASEWSGQTGVPVTFTMVGPRRDPGPEVEVTLLRSLQEALANIRKHAAASAVGVTLSYFDDRMSLDVRDDGVGFDPTRVPGGYGLLGMQERAARAGGTVAIESRPGGGTAVAVAVPLVPDDGTARRPAGSGARP